MIMEQIVPCTEIKHVTTEKAALKNIRESEFDLYVFDEVFAETLLSNAEVQSVGTSTLILSNRVVPPADKLELPTMVLDILHEDELTVPLLTQTLYHARKFNRLHQREARYRSIVEEQTEFLVRYKPDGTLSFVNEAYCQYRNKTRDELLGTSFLNTVLPDDHQRLYEALELVVNFGGTANCEVKAVSAGNLLVWHHWVVLAIRDRQNKIVEFQSVIRDISERKSVEVALNDRINELRALRKVDYELTGTLKFEHVINLAVDSAMRLSGADIVVLGLYNEKTKELLIERSLGIADVEPIKAVYRAQKGVIGRVIHTHKPEWIPDINKETQTEPTIPGMKSQVVIPLVSQERLMGIISLETRFPERFTSEVVDFLQLVAARMAVSIDNSRLYKVRQKQLEELQAFSKQISELEELKTDMIRIASHDLRNPIGVLQGYIEIMRWDIEHDRFDLEKFIGHMASMERAISRMQKITTDILSLERIEHSTRLSDEKVDLSLLIRDVAEEYHYIAREKHQRYLMEIPGIPTFIHGDHAQLREATANLIGNAIKYTPKYGTIEIKLECDGDAAIFEVIDTGYGIPFEMQEKLFKPFYRAKTRETVNIEGTGLGLHLVKNIIERHKGHMIFRSRYKEGSTFGFQIPAAPGLVML